MIDITDTILLIGRVRTKEPWPSCQWVLGEIVRATGGWTDWDDLSDEFWARVLRDRSVLAVVCMYAPIVFVVDRSVESTFPGFTTHDVPGFDAEFLSATAESLVETFGAVASGPEITPELFALSDLWFVSV